MNDMIEKNANLIKTIKQLYVKKLPVLQCEINILDQIEHHYAKEDTT
jgi:hypothetical protein